MSIVFIYWQEAVVIYHSKSWNHASFMQPSLNVNCVYNPCPWGQSAFSKIPDCHAISITLAPNFWTPWCFDFGVLIFQKQHIRCQSDETNHDHTVVNGSWGFILYQTVWHSNARHVIFPTIENSYTHNFHLFLKSKPPAGRLLKTTHCNKYQDVFMRERMYKRTCRFLQISDWRDNPGWTYITRITQKA